MFLKGGITVDAHAIDRSRLMRAMHFVAIVVFAK
jgi:hypothetical protein